ncbi:cell division protein FtsP [Proteus sp. FME41]|uniref:cell division protein FtsP n=1 Tax=Proteus sp. FME41 TaxID=2742608 RepID=UPI0018667C9A|nr:cell division protein FtsP [Proteus sp. FME41]
MSFSRRQFIQASGLAVCLGSISSSVRAESASDKQLPIPPLLESRRGQPIFLTLQNVHWAFNGSQKAEVWGINGSTPGPTIKVKSGDDIKLIYSNRLNEPVSMTVSGLLVPGTQVGGAARLMSPGAYWSPVLPIRQKATTCWYHANTPFKMAPHVYNGLVGMWIVEDEESQSLPLPKHYGVNDFPIIIQDKRIDNFGAPQYDKEAASEGFFGDTLLVNGREDPYIEVSRGWIRLRLVNASNARRYELTASDGRSLYLIASDQGLLTSPVELKSIPMAPGERREILVDMSEGGEVIITAGQSAGFMDKLRGIFEPSDLLRNANILTIKPTGLMSLVTDKAPQQLAVDDTQITTSIQPRTIQLHNSPPGINNARWELSRIDLVGKQNGWERWLVTVPTPQSFHIEGARFKVINHHGQKPSPADFGWKDTVWIESQSELLVELKQPSYSHFPFLYYSQLLENADKGMVGQMEITPIE